MNSDMTSWKTMNLGFQKMFSYQLFYKLELSFKIMASIMIIMNDYDSHKVREFLKTYELSGTKNV